MEIPGRSRYVPVAEQFLDRFYVDTLLQKSGSERMSEIMKPQTWQVRRFFD